MWWLAGRSPKADPNVLIISEAPSPDIREGSITASSLSGLIILRGDICLPRAVWSEAEDDGVLLKGLPGSDNLVGEWVPTESCRSLTEPYAGLVNGSTLEPEASPNPAIQAAGLRGSPREFLLGEVSRCRSRGEGI